jgi:hypothetical protein
MRVRLIKLLFFRHLQNLVLYGNSTLHAISKCTKETEIYGEIEKHKKHVEAIYKQLSFCKDNGKKSEFTNYFNSIQSKSIRSPKYVTEITRHICLGLCVKADCRFVYDEKVMSPRIMKCEVDCHHVVIG